jgi:Domain of unknown function (DUF4145)
MKCPHCQVEFHDHIRINSLGSDKDGFWDLETQTCPSCKRFVLQLSSKQIVNLHQVGAMPGQEILRYLVRPRVSVRPPPPLQVPAEFANVYIEASTIIGDSPQASAALSRRCLQYIIREKSGVTHDSLAKEIDQVLASNQLPSHLAEAIDAIRNIGNFAAHPIKSTNTGEIIPVEPGEAEWTLDVLDGLFDFYFVQPALLQQKKDNLNAKLAAANKPPVKG